jgi:hypothetical protein
MLQVRSAGYVSDFAAIVLGLRGVVPALAVDAAGNSPCYMGGFDMLWHLAPHLRGGF